MPDHERARATSGPGASVGARVGASSTRNAAQDRLGNRAVLDLIAAWHASGAAECTEDGPVSSTIPETDFSDPDDTCSFDAPETTGPAAPGLSATTPPPGIVTDAPSIEICTRIAELPVAQQLGLEHWWIRTPNLEMGMGPATGEVPGVDGDRGDLPYSATTVNDHTGQGASPSANCVPAAEWSPEWANVDPSCVEREGALGSQTGPWTPLWNDCHDWVENTMDTCDPDVQERRRLAAEEALHRYESGSPPAGMKDL